MEYQVRGPRALGGLSKPGAGALITMEVPPGGAVSLPVELLSRAREGVRMVVGGPDYEAAPGMIHEYNLLGLHPDEIGGVYNPEGYRLARASLLASIAELIRGGWRDLTQFLVYTQETMGFAIQDVLEARSPGGKELGMEVLRYYLDQITALGPQVAQVATELDTAGSIVEEKIRAKKTEYVQANRSLKALFDSAANLIRVLAEEFRRAIPPLGTPFKWGTVAIVGIAVVALAGAAIYFLPRPRRR